MRIPRYTPLALLAAALTVIPASAHSLQDAVLVAPPASEGCPVDFSAERRGDLELHQAADSHPGGSTQQLRFRLQHYDAAGIAEAELEVHLLPQGKRLMPAAETATHGRSQRFRFTAGAAASGLLERNIQLRDGLIDFADLTELRFVDGSVWHRSETSRCTAAPHGVMLVNAQP